jgi:hypothetical protein
MSRQVLFPLCIVVAISIAVTTAHADEPASATLSADDSASTSSAASAGKGDGGGVKTTWLLGHARTGRRRWVTGAAVLATPESGESRFYVTTTDEKGAYRFESIPEGSYDVTLTKHGLVSVTKDRVELRFPFRSVVEIVMEPGTGESAIGGSGPVSSDTDVVLEGSIRGREKEPLGEVRIRLIRADGTVDPRYALTGAEGRFEMNGLKAGDWHLEILGAGFLPIRVPVTLSGESAVTAILVKQPASYEPQPLDLMPPETPIAPPPLESGGTGAVADADPGA